MAVIDMVGQRFGRLKVIRRKGSYKRSAYAAALWECICDCGVVITVTGTRLRAGRAQGCDVTNHRRSYSAERQSYKGAKERCANPRNKAWKYYGGRGIEFRFKNFDEFYAELGPRPIGMAVDRIDNDGHYEKGNVRWATSIEQRANRR